MMTGRVRSTVRAAGVLAVVAAGALTGCAQQGWESRCDTDAEGIIACAPDERPEARNVTGTLLDGSAYDISRDRGTVVVVNFWGSWCAPCRAEADDLQRTYQATKDRGVTFLGVNWRDAKDAAKAFERSQRVTYPSLFDPRGEVALAFEVSQANTPTTLVLDRQGRIAAAKRGSVTADQLQRVVERIAAEPVAAGPAPAGPAPAGPAPAGPAPSASAGSN